MSGQEYQEVEAILENRGFVQDLFHRFQIDLDRCCETHYGKKFTRVINDDGFLLLFLQAIVAAHSDPPAESNAVCRRHTGEPHTEDSYFQANWHHPHNPHNPQLATLDTLFIHDGGYPSPTDRVEEVRKVIAIVDQQLPEDTPMPDPHNQNQPQQQQTQPLPSPEPYQVNTTSNNPQIQLMRTQQPFFLALHQQSSGQCAMSHTSESGESSGAQSDNSFASGRKSGKRVAGRYSCTVEDCPKKDELMQKCRLDDHMALHEPGLRTQCPAPACGKIYMHSRTCNDHAKKTHGMDLKTLYEHQSKQYARRAASLGNMEEDEAVAMAVTS